MGWRGCEGKGEGEGEVWVRWIGVLVGRFWWEEGVIGGFHLELCIISCNEDVLVMRELPLYSMKNLGDRLCRFLRRIC